jgi:hypothetical protein
MGYLDPGIFGILSQAGLAILLILVSAFTFFFKPIKKTLSRIFKGKKLSQSENTTTDEQTAPKQPSL